MPTIGQHSDDHKEMIASAIEKLVAALGPDDSRVIPVETDRSAPAIQHLLHAVLSKRVPDHAK